MIENLRNADPMAFVALGFVLALILVKGVEFTDRCIDRSRRNRAIGRAHREAIRNGQAGRR